MLYTKIQPQSFLSTGEEDFSVFSPNMGMTAILFSGAEPFEQIVNKQSFDRRPHVKSGENWWRGFREEDV